MSTSVAGPCSMSADELDASIRSSVAAFRQAFANLGQRISPDASPDDDAVLNELTQAVHLSREECQLATRDLIDDPVRLKAAQTFLREQIAPWCDQSWFVHRAKVKPRGYPGDFEMLTAIYDEVVKTRGIGGYLDRYFLQTDLARAVRSRLAGVKAFLIEEASRRQKPMKVLNVASGPGREYDEKFLPVADLLDITCVDSDQGALDYLQASAQAKLGSALRLTCVNYNALKMTSAKANIERFGRSDFIYSVGLCDYIPDKFLIKMLSGWRESLAPDGIVYVAFKDCTKYVAAEYQWHVDWHFFERTEEDCRNLFLAAGYDVDTMTMSRDDSGIIMNFVARPAASAVKAKLLEPHIDSRAAQLSAVPQHEA